MRKSYFRKSIGDCLGTLYHHFKNITYGTCHFSGIFRNKQITNLKHWVFFSFLEVPLKLLEKIIHFSKMKQPHSDMPNDLKICETYVKYFIVNDLINV